MAQRTPHLKLIVLAKKKLIFIHPISLNWPFLSIYDPTFDDAALEFIIAQPTPGKGLPFATIYLCDHYLVRKIT